MSVKACLISSAFSGIAARFSMASGAARVRTNCSGSTSPPMTGGNSYRWSQKHYAKNCQLKKLRRETIPKVELRTPHGLEFPQGHPTDDLVDCADEGVPATPVPLGRGEGVPIARACLAHRAYDRGLPTSVLPEDVASRGVHAGHIRYTLPPIILDEFLRDLGGGNLQRCATVITGFHRNIGERKQQGALVRGHKLAIRGQTLKAGQEAQLLFGCWSTHTRS